MAGTRCSTLKHAVEQWFCASAQFVNVAGMLWAIQPGVISLIPDLLFDGMRSDVPTWHCARRTL